MKKIFLLIIILFVSNIEAQNLEPNNSIFDIYNFEFEYYSKIRNKLFKDMSDDPMIRLLVTPSFSPEYIFQIERDGNNEYLAKLNIANKNIWYNKEIEKIIVNQHVAKINENDVNLLNDVYSSIIDKVHHPIKESIGMDGTTYYLSVWKTGLKSGEIWSPKDSINKTITNITQELINEIKQNNVRVSLSDKNRNILKAISLKINNSKNIESYKLILKTKEIIENNKPFYISKLINNHKLDLENFLKDFEKKILLELTFNNLNLDYINELIKYYNERFINIIQHDTNKSEVENLEEYQKNNQLDNIFLKLESELK